MAVRWRKLSAHTQKRNETNAAEKLYTKPYMKETERKWTRKRTLHVKRQRRKIAKDLQISNSKEIDISINLSETPSQTEIYQLSFNWVKVQQ